MWSVLRLYHLVIATKPIEISFEELFLYLSIGKLI
jgi:hypothetical protein